MKKTLLAATAFVALGVTSVSAPAQAQSGTGSYDKGADSRILSQRQYSAPETERVAEAAPIEEEVRYEDVQYVEPAAGGTPESEYNGFYVGGGVGYNIGSYEVNNPSGADGDAGLDGYEAGLFAGYGLTQGQAGNLAPYVGLEVGYDWSGAGGRVGAVDYEKDKEWLVTLRPGAVFGNRTLGYGIIGYSRGKFETDVDDQNLDGLVLGAGAEFGSDAPVKMRVEYSYTNYADEDIGDISFDGHENEIKVGAVMRF